MFNSSNPVFGRNIFETTARDGNLANTMTVKGTMSKAMIMLALVVLGASYTWKVFTESATPNAAMGWMIAGAIGGFITALIISFVPKTASWLSPIYAILQGLFLGTISAFFESMYPGIVVNAVGLTLALAFLLFFIYRTGIIQVTNKLRVGIIAATGAIALFYLVVWIVSLFGGSTAIVTGSSNLSIGISIVVVIIAAMNLLLDFDFIQKGEQAGAPKYMEWYGAFGLMVTLIWLYLEILKLLAKFAARRD
jgi:Predicted membrane protein